MIDLNGPTWTPRHWAKLGIYRALNKRTRGIISVSECASQMVWAVQRLAMDESGELLPKDDLHTKALQCIDPGPQQGTELADMGEWAEWIIDRFLPGKRHV